MNIYYVYAYLREKDNTPYYIGKGKNKRAYSKEHSVSVPKDKSKIIFYHTNLTEFDAHALEKYYIKFYGRKDLGTGILYNQTDGGDGGDTSKSKAYLKAKAENKFSTKGMKNTPEHNQKIANALRGKKRPAEVIQKMIKTRRENNLPSPKKDLQIYTFYHKEHGVFKGTRHEFNNKFGEGKIIINDMFASKPRPRKGWIVVEKWIEAGLLDSFSERC
jgi:hypothetical protein